MSREGHTLDPTPPQKFGVRSEVLKIGRSHDRRKEDNSCVRIRCCRPTKEDRGATTEIRRRKIEGITDYGRSTGGQKDNAG